ncbi:MAG: autotransporter domain-containing protein [Sphingosinicella sp.]|nr:autotransporter domain-containing protein [Sphingosinicella sp.]
MRNLLACTYLTPALLLAATAAHSETSIATKATNPVRTSTVKDGAPDDVKVTSAGSIVPDSAGAGITIDSNNNAVNEGTISFTDFNNSTGIQANAGRSGTITNGGKIEVIETYTAKDNDNDGDLDGAFASGSGRFGIRLAPGGTFTGAVTNSGTINIEGNDSAGIAADSRLAGSLTNSGTIALVGDRSVAIRVAEVTGDVRLNGTIGASGLDAMGVALDGNIGGALVIQGAVASTGYRFVTLPADVSKLDADDLLQGGSALRVTGDVAKGILFDAPPPNNSATDNDEDKDGIEDSKETTASVTSFGSAAAVQIGAADHAVSIGPVTGNVQGHGIVVNGGIAGRGVYSGVSATGIKIGGLGGAVNIAGGLTVNGQAAAASNGASATAIHIAIAASVNEIRITGTVQADGGGTATSLNHAILIEQGATVTAVRNSGKIAASTSSNGTAGAIVDRSGSLALIENSGAINATGVGLDTSRAIAIDLRNNASGAIVRQTQVGQNVTAPTISGNILFGAGDDLLDLADGEVKGATQFGTGANRLNMSGDARHTGNVQFGAGADRLMLAGTSAFVGAADFGGGADLLTLSDNSIFSGALTNANALRVQVSGGTFEVTTTMAPVAIDSLEVGAKGILGVTIDARAGKSTSYQVAGAASFAEGSKVSIKLVTLGDALGRFTILKAGSLTGTAGLSSNSLGLPIFLKSSLVADEQVDELAVLIERRSAADIGLNRSEAGAWDAIYAVLDADEDVAGAFLEMEDAETFREAMQQMLPEHAGGAFETVTQGSRATARILKDPGSPLADMGNWGFWLQQVAWGTSKNIGNTSSYDITGWGAAGGAEFKLGGIGNAGLSVAYLNGQDAQSGNDNEVRANQYELAAYWRGKWGGLAAHARASAAMIGFDGTRTFRGTVSNETVTRTASGEWDGQLYSAAAGLSYEIALGRLSFRPAVSVDYYRLSEDGYTETGGGDAMNLSVKDRTSDEAAAEVSLAAGYELMSGAQSEGWLRTEIEGGRRQIIGGDIGETIARFGTGDSFTLLPENRSDGWVGKFRLTGGNDEFSLGGEFSAEEQQGRAAIALRLGLQAVF